MKKTNWLIKHTVTVFSCVLIIALGIAFLSHADQVTTTIGENISTNDLTATGVISLPLNSITDAMAVDTLTVSNYLPLLGGIITGDLTVDNIITEGGISLISKYLGIADKATDADKLDNQDSTYFTNASNLASGEVSSDRISGDYSNITGLGTIASGDWQGTAIGTQYGGTGQDWSAVVANSIPYFSDIGTLSTVSPSADGLFLMSNGASFAPTWDNVTRSATFVVAASDSLHPEQADYVCSGTADDVQIQQAIDVANTNGGGKVVLMEGLYSIDNELTISSNITLQGAGGNTILQASADRPGNWAIINPNSVTNIVIADIKLDGNKTNQSAIAGVAYGIHFETVTNSIIRNVIIIDCGLNTVAYSGYGIILQANSVENIISGCIISGVKHCGITIYDGSDNCIVDSCIIHDSSNNGITSHGVNNTVISNNQITNAANWGIYPHGGSGNAIIGNSIDSATLYSIYVSKEDDFIVNNNTIANGGNCAIFIDSDCSNGIVSANHILNCIDGINVVGDDIVISQNSINTLTGLGGVAGILASGDRLIVSGNVVTGATYGIQVRSDYHIIIGNYAYQNTTGIYLNSAEHCLVISNIVSDNGGGSPGTKNGIYVDPTSHYNTITGNTGQKGTMQERGIRIFSGATHNYIADNYFNDAGTVSNIQDLNTYSTNILYEQYSGLFMDALAASVTYVRSNEDLSEAIPNTFTIDAQPDIPRTLSGHFDAHAQITAYTIDIVGVDAKGNTITEQKTEVDGWDWETSNAFATITSIIMSARTGTGAGDTIDIGITDVLGLSNIIYASGDVYKVKKNNADVSIGTVNTTYGTVDCTTISDGDDFTIWYKSNLNIIE